mgnify:CR=1 FL=1
MGSKRDPMAGDWMSWILLGDFEYVSKQEAEARLAELKETEAALADEKERHQRHDRALTAEREEWSRAAMSWEQASEEAEADAEWLYAELAGEAHASAYLADNPDCSACQALAAHEQRIRGGRE